MSQYILIVKSVCPRGRQILEEIGNFESSTDAAGLLITSIEVITFNILQARIQISDRGMESYDYKGSSINYMTNFRPFFILPSNSHVAQNSI